MSIRYWVSAIIVACIAFSAFHITSTAYAEDTITKSMPKKPVPPKVNGALKDFNKRYNHTTGMLKGPFDVVITPTDKGTTGHKYSNVPYVQLMWGGVIAFPAGEKDHGRRAGVIIYATTYTLETK